MLIQCNFLDDLSSDNQTSSCVVQEIGSSRKEPFDEDVGASESILSRSKRYVWRCIHGGTGWRNRSSASLFKRSIFAIFSGITLCSIVGGMCLFGLFYFGRADSAERYSAPNATPRLQDVQAMHHERHGVMVMTRFLQQQVNRRQSVANWWQLLAESTVLLHGIEWQRNAIEFTVSGRFSAINELMTKARSLNGSMNVVLREFRPDTAHRHSGSITGVAQLKMTLCDVSQRAVLTSSEGSSAVEGARRSPSNGTLPIHTAFLSNRDVSNDDCAPMAALLMNEALHVNEDLPMSDALSTNSISMTERARHEAPHHEKGIDASPVDDALINQKELMTEGPLDE